MSTSVIRIAGEGLTVSLITWRKFKRPAEGYVEEVFDLNPGMASRGPHLVIGSDLRLPDQAPAPAAPAVISLWD